MANAAQRQRKLAEKAARRKAAVAEKKLFEREATSLAGRVRVAAKGPIVLCKLPSALFEMGIGNVVLARALPSGLVGFAFFLVDAFCLGVKDVCYGEVGERELRSRLAVQNEVQTFIDVDPAYARKMIRDAVAYAAGLGLAAAEDTAVIEAIFGDVDPDDCTDTFTFGKDGKPFFVSGPNDTPARIRAIEQALQKSRAAGGWDFLVDVSSSL